MDALRLKNAKMLALVERDGMADPQNVMTVEWDTLLSPLSWEEVVAEWARLCHTDPSLGDGRDSTALLAHVLHCSDRGYLCFNDIVKGAPRAIFPAAAVQLCLCPDSPATWGDCMATWDMRLQDGCLPALHELSRAPIAQVVVPAAVAGAALNSVRHGV